ncbi:MAG: LuxR family transcriptional regulator [Halomonas sp.]|nr:helix-turn-helix transcriptional regulator [Halomonas sp.]TVP42744.1 MAG: LuxR family transcriptional regulator [Halomonas sp.]
MSNQHSALIPAGGVQQALASTIDALHTAHFTSHLTHLLRTLVEFDCAVIVGYRSGKHPIYLYDSLHQRRELLFQRYLLHAYQFDPFLQQLEQRKEENVFHAVGANVRSRDWPSHYHQDFYQQTGWQDELCMTLRLVDARWIVVYLGVTGEQKQTHFTDTDCHVLKGYLCVLAALCRQHWGQAPFHLSTLPVNSGIGEQLQQAAASFGKTLLTKREQQVAALMVQGLDTQEIAEYLAIGHGTVKNHRKRVYAQLSVSSLSELFGVFLNHAAASGAVADK